MSITYRCFFLDQDHKISWAQDVPANDDTEAISTAKSMSATQKAPAFEVWHGVRLVHREGG